MYKRETLEELSIALVCDYFYPSLGGIETHIMELATELKKQNHKVIIITHSTNHNGIEYEGLRFLKIDIGKCDTCIHRNKKILHSLKNLSTDPYKSDEGNSYIFKEHERIDYLLNRLSEYPYPQRLSPKSINRKSKKSSQTTTKPRLKAKSGMKPLQNDQRLLFFFFNKMRLLFFCVLIKMISCTFTEIFNLFKRIVSRFTLIIQLFLDFILFMNEYSMIESQEMVRCIFIKWISRQILRSIFYRVVSRILCQLDNILEKSISKLRVRVYLVLKHLKSHYEEIHAQNLCKSSFYSLRKNKCWKNLNIWMEKSRVFGGINMSLEARMLYINNMDRQNGFVCRKNKSEFIDCTLTKTCLFNRKHDKEDFGADLKNSDYPSKSWKFRFHKSDHTIKNHLNSKIAETYIKENYKEKNYLLSRPNIQHNDVNNTTSPCSKCHLKVYYLRLPIVACNTTFPTLISNFPVFYEIFNAEKINIVHGHQTMSNLALEAMFHAQRLNLSTVFTEHSLFEIGKVESIIVNKLCSFVLSDVDIIVCVSYATKENLIERLFLDSKKIYVIPNGCNLSLFHPGHIKSNIKKTKTASDKAVPKIALNQKLAKNILFDLIVSENKALIYEPSQRFKMNTKKHKTPTKHEYFSIHIDKKYVFEAPMPFDKVYSLSLLKLYHNPFMKYNDSIPMYAIVFSPYYLSNFFKSKKTAKKFHRFQFNIALTDVTAAKRFFRFVSDHKYVCAVFVIDLFNKPIAFYSSSIRVIKYYLIQPYIPKFPNRLNIQLFVSNESYLPNFQSKVVLNFDYKNNIFEGNQEILKISTSVDDRAFHYICKSLSILSCRYLVHQNKYNHEFVKSVNSYQYYAHLGENQRLRVIKNDRNVETKYLKSYILIRKKEKGHTQTSSYMLDYLSQNRHSCPSIDHKAIKIRTIINENQNSCKKNCKCPLRPESTDKNSKTITNNPDFTYIKNCLIKWHKIKNPAHPSFLSSKLNKAKIAFQKNHIFSRNRFTDSNKNDIYDKYSEIKKRLKDKTVIIFISRLVERKGINILIRALPHICNIRKNIHILIAGTGPKEFEILQVIDEKRLRNQVTLIGTIPYLEVPEFLQLGRIFLNTSLTESFCMAILEAAVCGLFVVSTDVGGIREVLDSEISILTKTDPYSIREACAKAIDIIEQEQFCIQKQYQIAKRSYDWKLSAQNHLKLYKKALIQNRNKSRLDHYSGFTKILFFLAKIMQIWIFIFMKNLRKPNRNINQKHKKSDSVIRRYSKTNHDFL